MIHCWYKFQFDLNAKQNMSFKMLIMHQLNPCSNIPPWAFELVKVGLFKFPPCEAKIVFKCTSQFLVKGKISGHYFLHWPHFKTETLFFGGCLETKIKYLPLNTSILKDTDNNCIPLDVLDSSGVNPYLPLDFVKTQQLQILLHNTQPWTVLQGKCLWSEKVFYAFKLLKKCVAFSWHIRSLYLK